MDSATREFRRKGLKFQCFLVPQLWNLWKNLRSNSNLTIFYTKTFVYLFSLETADILFFSTELKPLLSAQNDIFSASYNQIFSNKISFSSFALCILFGFCQLLSGIASTATKECDRQFELVDSEIIFYHYLTRDLNGTWHWSTFGLSWGTWIKQSCSGQSGNDIVTAGDRLV